MLLAALKAKKGSNFHWGLVCSSWVALCRFSSGRTFLAPEGDRELSWVEAGNKMVSRLGKGILHTINFAYNVLNVPQVLPGVLPLDGEGGALDAGAAG